MQTTKYKSGEYQGGIVKKLEVEGCVISNTFYTKQHRSDWHYHENAHLALLFHPSKAETKNKEKYANAKGMIFTYHEGETHRFTTQKGYTAGANIEISQDFLQKYQMTFSSFRENLLQKENAKSLIIQTQAELFGKDFNKKLNVLSLLLEMMSARPKNYHGQPPWLEQLKDLLHDNWDKNLSLDEMAKLISVHPVTISKYFRKYLGCTIGQYRRKVRVEKSLALIKSGKMSLTEITYHCNYADQSHFTREFKLHTGFRPLDFKRM